MNLLRTIIQFEMRWLIRTRILLLLLCIYLFTGGFALYYGHGVMADRQLVIDSIQNDYRHRFDSLVNTYRAADTGTAAGRTAVFTLGEPAVVQFRLKPEAMLMPPAFSSMSIGISDMAGYHHTVDMNRSYIDGEEKLSNPLKLLTGNIDLSFILIYIIPLTVIALSYNLIFAEQDAGTLLLLQLQCKSLTTLLTVRLLIRWALLVVLYLLLSITGMVLSVSNKPTITSFLYWTSIAAFYTGIWTGITFSVLRMKRSAGFNAITLLSTWIVLLIAIPAACSLLYASRQHAPVHMATIASEQRSTEWAVWEMPKKQLLDSFYAAYPGCKNARAYDTNAASGRRGMAYYHLVQQRMNRFVQKNERMRIQEARALSFTYLFNPAVYTQSLCNEVAGTDITDYMHYHRQLTLFHEQWKQFFYAFTFHDRKFAPGDYYTLPNFVMERDPEKESRIIKGILSLLGLCLCSWLPGFLFLKKKFINKIVYEKKPCFVVAHSNFYTRNSAGRPCKNKVIEICYRIRQDQARQKRQHFQHAEDRCATGGNTAKHCKH